MSALNRIVIATKNKEKLVEIRDILSDISVDIVILEEVGFYKDVKESGESYSENALIKAREIYRFTGYAVISDDSGLEVDALGGRPGIYSARYATTTTERIRKLLEELSGIPFEKRRAKFVCVACFLLTEDKYYFFRGEVEGYISFKPRGKNGFGFDPVFFIPEYGKTMAELSKETKNKISHRAKAFMALKEFIRNKGYL